MPRKVTTPPNSKNASKTPAKAAKVPAKTASAAASKSTGASKAPAKSTTKAAKAPTKSTAASKVKPKEDRSAFLASQRQLLLDERANYIRSAEVLKAQADSLALEHEPGDVQFDEEGGEGGTSNVDRELDLVLSAQARAAAAEIDRALAKIQAGTYGLCEQCGQPIPDARLQALPQAALCVACKSGGLSSRR
jgi:DnaK suppressor protein